MNYISVIQSEFLRQKTKFGIIFLFFSFSHLIIPSNNTDIIHVNNQTPYSNFRGKANISTTS